MSKGPGTAATKDQQWLHELYGLHKSVHFLFGSSTLRRPGACSPAHMGTRAKSPQSDREPCSCQRALARTHSLLRWKKKMMVLILTIVMITIMSVIMIVAMTMMPAGHVHAQHERRRHHHRHHGNCGFASAHHEPVQCSSTRATLEML